MFHWDLTGLRQEKTLHEVMFRDEDSAVHQNLLLRHYSRARFVEML
jgi:hypothetical protein